MTDEELVTYVAIACAAGLGIDEAWTVVREAASDQFASGEELSRKVYKGASTNDALDNHYVL